MRRAVLDRSGPAVVLSTATLSGVVVFVVGVASCANAINIGFQDNDASAIEAGSGLFTAPDTGDASSVVDAAALCIATDCPEMRGTCLAPGAAVPKCATRLSVDPGNCGVCGNVCAPLPESFNASNVCVDGACKLVCETGFADCNGNSADGCEASLLSDSANCGGCGSSCPSDTHCDTGNCQPIPPPPLDCDACPPPPSGKPPAHMRYACATGKCNALVCLAPWSDCNGIQDDGCEVDLLHDPQNCSACGNVCPDDESCLAFGVTSYCGCAPGFSLCDNGCYDLQSDPHNCGACGFGCGIMLPISYENLNYKYPTCHVGQCQIECLDGWADCNSDPVDGCETDLSVTATHCGQCGHTCDVLAGQPCVDGSCLMKECEGTPTQ